MKCWTKRKNSTRNRLFAPSRHPLLRWSHLTYGKLILVAFLMFSPAGALLSLSGAVAEKSDKKKEALWNQFLLFGTVFTEEGFGLPGAEIRVRRADERKARWQARSDGRGEFAVRVPVGAEYEVSVVAKGYQEQTRKVDARTGTREDFVFRLRPAPGEKRR